MRSSVSTDLVANALRQSRALFAGVLSVDEDSISDKGITDVRQIYICKQNGEQFFELEVSVEMKSDIDGAAFTSLLFRGTKSSVIVLACEVVDAALANSPHHEAHLRAWLEALTDFSAQDTASFLISR